MPRALVASLLLLATRAAALPPLAYAPLQHGTFQPEGCEYSEGEPLLICEGKMGGGEYVREVGVRKS